MLIVSVNENVAVNLDVCSEIGISESIVTKGEWKLIAAMPWADKMQLESLATYPNEARAKEELKRIILAAGNDQKMYYVEK